MNKTLNELKKEIFGLALNLNERTDQTSPISDIIFIASIKFTYYKQTDIYSLKTCEENFNEISNRFILSLIKKNLSTLWQLKKKDPTLKIHQRVKK